MKMNIAIIGAGIYGCHLALKLSNCDYKVDVYEMNDDIFSGASTNNSFRIHKGYHYPRSGKTREMCMRDEIRFCNEYSHLIEAPEKNSKIFCVANNNKTLIDYTTMKLIMSGSGLPYSELTTNELSSLGFKHIEGGFRVNEAILMVDEAKKWFAEILKNNGVSIYFNHCINKIDNSGDKIKINDNTYDYVLNCTYNQTLHYESQYGSYFDLCFYLIVASKKNKEECNIESFGIFDGPFPSLEPYGYKDIPEKYKKYQNKKIFQVFHVKHTIVAKSKNIEEIRQLKNGGLKKQHEKDVTQNILNEIISFFPKFLEEFDVIGNCLELRYRADNLCDDRPLIAEVDESIHPRFIQVVSSKLTSIFSAEDKVIDILKSVVL